MKSPPFLRGISPLNDVKEQEREREKKRKRKKGLPVKIQPKRSFSHQKFVYGEFLSSPPQ